jgi:hypothetical protein
VECHEESWGGGGERTASNFPDFHFIAVVRDCFFGLRLKLCAPCKTQEDNYCIWIPTTANMPHEFKDFVTKIIAAFDFT